MSENGHKPRIERAVELCIYAPLGLALFAHDVLPPLIQQFVMRGRSQVEGIHKRVAEQVGEARTLGQFAVSQGPEQVKRQVEARLGEVRQRGEALGRILGRPDAGNAPRATTTATSPTAPVEAPGPDGSALPIPDYDELSASQVVARLPGLEGAELEAVRDYEAGRRQRKTILSKIDQLSR